MKKYKVFAIASVFALGLTSCGDFGDTNIDPEHLNEGNVPVAMLFSNGQHQALGSDWDIWRNSCIHASQWIQHMTSIQWWEDYGRYTWSDAYSGAYWDTYSGDRGAMRDITTAYDKWKEEAGMTIDWNIARVMRVYAFSKMTDLYGDIPYSQAGRPGLYSYPEYDTQESIYKSMLTELDEAQANLGSGTAQMKSHDVYFQGDAASWKRFANSLMLRLAMRLVKVDEGTAKTYAAKALANGLITTTAQNVKLDHPGGVTTNDSAEPFAKINAHEDKEFFMSKTFIDILKESNDPRLALIATVCTNPDISVQSADYEYGNSDPAIQQGLPSGGYSNGPSSPYFIGKVDSRFDASEGNIYHDTPGDAGVHFKSRFSVPNRYTYSDPEAPTFIVTNAQTQLLLAEAALRGYISGDAATYFEAGIRAAMEQFGQFPSKGASTLVDTYLTADAVDAYVAAQKTAFVAADTEAKKEMINTQYWINSFGDEYEAFANWRRSGYPALEASPFCIGTANADGNSQSKGIPRRFRYPTSEDQINTTNYQAAVSRLSGGDRFDSRIWWDK
ncbi:MAG: SusD/RagB family nutrient-binding outer membrane lipoprotein [Prevotella sp.]|nr:SusD/RagB family nutrient-binding outer membrane lipoprotein [Prevotella sp.]